MNRIVITGSGAICGTGTDPASIVDALVAGQSAIGPITSWDAANWPCQVAAPVTEYTGGKLLGDR